MSENRFLVMLNVQVDGSYTPVSFQKEKLSSDTAIIVIDDVTQIVWVWIGDQISVVQRSIASRASNYIAKYGYMVDQFKIGAGFTRRLIEEQFVEDLETKEAYHDFFHLFELEKTSHDGYYTVEIEGRVRGSILEKEEFQNAKETMQTWLEEALLVIDGLEESGIAAEDIPKHVQAMVTAPGRHEARANALLGVSSDLQPTLEEATPPLTEEHRELRDGIVEFHPNRRNKLSSLI